MTEGWTRHEGKTVHLPLDNVDTDQIIPARFMSTPRSEGYGRFLFYDMSRNADGEQRSDFPLNDAADASILIAGRNFGCGSSREAAVYALIDAGIRVVVAPGFGDIFASNAVNNGLLPARVSDEVMAAVVGAENSVGTPASVDLDDLLLTIDGRHYDFQLDPVWRTKLIKGWDDIDLTKAEGDRIAAFRDTRNSAAPWVWPSS